jgi:hypothetical protein
MIHLALLGGAAEKSQNDSVRHNLVTPGISRGHHSTRFRGNIEEAPGPVPPHGRAVQVDPIKPTLQALGTKLLKLKHDKLSSSVTFNFNLSRYTTFEMFRKLKPYLTPCAKQGG